MNKQNFSDQSLNKDMVQDLKLARDFFDAHFVNHEVLYIYKKNNELSHLSVNMQKFNFMHLFGVTYFNANQLYKDLSDKRISKLNMRNLKQKKDGTTRQKLDMAKYLPTLIRQGVCINDKQEFETFTADNIIRSKEKLLAFCLHHEEDKYIPKSLLDLRKNSKKEQQLTPKHPVIYIRKLNNLTKQKTLLYVEHSEVDVINDYIFEHELGVLYPDSDTSQKEEIVSNETDISLKTQIVTSYKEEIVSNETEVSLRTEIVTSQTEEISIKKTDTSFEKETDKLIKRIEDTVHYTEQNLSSNEIKKDFDMD